MTGDVLLRCSAGRLGFKGARKGTPFAASQIGSTLAKEMVALGIKQVEVNLEGPGSGRDSVVRAFNHQGLMLLYCVMLHHYHTMVLVQLKSVAFNI